MLLMPIVCGSCIFNFLYICYTQGSLCEQKYKASTLKQHLKTSYSIQNSVFIVLHQQNYSLHRKPKHSLHLLVAESLTVENQLSVFFFLCTVISCFPALDGSSAKFLLLCVLMAHLLFYFSSVCLLSRFITFAWNNSFEITTSFHRGFFTFKLFCGFGFPLLIHQMLLEFLWLLKKRWNNKN